MTTQRRLDDPPVGYVYEDELAEAIKPLLKLLAQYGGLHGNLRGVVTLVSLRVTDHGIEFDYIPDPDDDDPIPPPRFIHLRATSRDADTPPEEEESSDGPASSNPE